MIISLSVLCSCSVEQGPMGPQGVQGETGNGVSSITLTESKDLVDTYTIYYTDGSTTTFTVTNGKDGSQGIQGIQGEPGKDGHTPVITIENGYWYIDGVNTLQPAQGVQGETGNGISSIKLTNTDGLVDTYTIYFTDGQTTTFTVTNGKDGATGAQGIQGVEGQPGKDGVSVQSIEIDEQANLIITLSDGTKLPPIKFPDSGDENTINDAILQEARDAVISYLFKNVGKEELAEYMIYKAGEKYVALHNGVAVGVYDSSTDALEAMSLDSDNDLIDLGDGKLFAYSASYIVSLDQEVLTITDKNGKKTLVTLPKLPETNILFSRKDLSDGVCTPVPTYSSISLNDVGYNLHFKVDDMKVDLCTTVKNIPEGYYLFEYRYPIKEDGSTKHSHGWSPLSNGVRVYNAETMPSLGYKDYYISICFSSDPNTLVPVEAPDNDWSIVFHEYGTVATESANYIYKIVDINGNGDYTNVATAVDSEPENTVLVILPGTYVGTVEAFQKSIILVGTDQNTCVLKSYDGRRAYPVINGSCGYFANLTMHAEYVPGVSHEMGAEAAAYAFHVEHEYGVGKTLELHDCTLISDFFPALGMGLRKDFTCIIDNCELISNQPVGRGSYTDKGSLGALYFHDSVGEKGKSYVIVQNSILRSKLENVMCPYTLVGISSYPNANQNTVYCTFINNTLFSEKTGDSGIIWHRNGDAFKKNFVLTEDSCGNTNIELNYSDIDTSK